MKRLAFGLVMLAAATASAEPAVEGHAIGVAVNEPLGWVDAAAIGASAYLQISAHNVVRANFATWDHAHTSTFGSEAKYAGGRYTDGGVSWMYFPRKAYDGFSVELGGVVRHDNSWDIDDFDQKLTNDKNVYGARVLVGWSWLFKERGFISAQLGASVGPEHGTITSEDTVEPGVYMPITTRVDRIHVSPEYNLRFGFLI
jgi:hypothetical protein